MRVNETLNRKNGTNVHEVLNFTVAILKSIGEISAQLIGLMLFNNLLGI